jgi:hypothetical protein
LQLVDAHRTAGSKEGCLDKVFDFCLVHRI